MSLFPGTPEMESRSCPETVPVGVPGLWDVISPRPNLGSGWGLNQSYSPQREFSNAMLHSRSARRERVDSRLLVVGSQTTSLTRLTPGPSFAHNLGCRCSNDQCEAIFDIYVSRPFQWHQKRLNARCFGPFCRALNIRESQRTPIPQLFQVLGFTPTLGQSRVATTPIPQLFQVLGFTPTLGQSRVATIWLMCRSRSSRFLSTSIPKKKCNSPRSFISNFWLSFFFICKSLFWSLHTEMKSST